MITPADINRLIARDEHACALRELAFWLTVPGFRTWQEFDVAADGTRIVTDAPPWPLPVHVHEAPVYGPWWSAPFQFSTAGDDYDYDIVNNQPVIRWRELDPDSVVVGVDVCMERGDENGETLPVAPRLTVLAPKCVTCDNPAQVNDQYASNPDSNRPFWPDCYNCVRTQPTR